jgi:phosphatidylserine/phosphatidylglycerophosphate/cardiolipin synthase-like enzyme
MPGGDLRREIFLNTIKADVANGTCKSLGVLQGRFPSLSQDECLQITECMKAALAENDRDKVSLVVTAPPSFSLNAKPTMAVVRSMLEGAENSILITGYSMSSYFSELADIIIAKSQSGVFVKFFINDLEKQSDVDKLLRYKGRFLEIYDYSNDKDKMAALHAKVISVDMKRTLITSANLSYHGQQGNIELGALIESTETARQLDDIMTNLIFRKIFRKV